MEAAIEQVPGLIKETTKHRDLLQIMVGLRAVGVHADGPAYDVMVTHQHLLKYLVDILDLPVKSYSAPQDQELRINLQKESLWVLTNLSLADGVNERLHTDLNIREVLQALILEHFVDRPANSKNRSEDKLTEVELSLLENVLWLTGNLAVDFAYSL